MTKAPADFPKNVGQIFKLIDGGKKKVFPIKFESERRANEKKTSAVLRLWGRPKHASLRSLGLAAKIH